MMQPTPEKTKDDLLTVLAHELRNPLATIMSTVELINAQGVSEKETPDLLAVVDERVRAIAAVLNDLLDESRISRNNFILEKDPTLNKKIPSISIMHPIAPDALRVLIVDDNEAAADSLSQLLALRGYNVQIAYGGSSALERARTFLPQVAILDIGMPDMDGYELASKLAQEHVSCVYVALTGFGQLHDKQKALAAGFSVHLTKPASIKEIEAVLERVATAVQAKSV
jgi:CheY-like chemotaxis protein